MKFPGGILAATILLCGCAGRAQLRPLTPEDVVDRHKAGAAAAEIIRDIEVTDSRFYLGVADVLALREAGVPDLVIDRMLQSGWRPERVYYYYDDFWWHHRFDPYWPHRGPYYR